MNIKKWIQEQPAHIVLIAINVAVFAIQSLSVVILGLLKINNVDYLTDLFSLHSDLNEFMFKPWGIFTYMFLHDGISHLFWNMIFLFLVGKVFESYFNKSITFSVFIVGGLISGLATLLAYNLFPEVMTKGDHQMVGASGSIYSIILGITSYKHRVSIPIISSFAIPVLFLSIIKVLVDLSTLASDVRDDGIFNINTGGHIAHLAGATYGVVFGLQYKKGKNILSWYQKLNSRFSSNKTSYNSNMKVVYRKSAKNVSDEDYNYSKQSNEQRLNDILDKVGKSGYDSLSKEEKDFLNFISNR